MEEVDNYPKWFKYCEEPSIENEEALKEYLNSMDYGVLCKVSKEYLNSMDYGVLCKVLKDDYISKLKRNSQCHNETTIATMSTVKDIADIYFLFQRNDLVFCLEERDVKLAIEYGKNPHNNYVISVQEINKMKEWLTKKRLHSLEYEADEVSEYQQARNDFIEFMDYLINKKDSFLLIYLEKMRLN